MSKAFPLQDHARHSVYNVIDGVSLMQRGRAVLYFVRSPSLDLDKIVGDLTCQFTVLGYCTFGLLYILLVTWRHRECVGSYMERSVVASRQPHTDRVASLTVADVATAVRTELDGGKLLTDLSAVVGKQLDVKFEVSCP
jgi:hypothetical protein